MLKPSRQVENEAPTLTIASVIERYGLTRSRIYVLLEEGAIKAIKVGRRTLVRTDSINEFIAKMPTAVFGKSAKARALEKRDREQKNAVRHRAKERAVRARKKQNAVLALEKKADLRDRAANRVKNRRVRKGAGNVEETGHVERSNLPAASIETPGNTA
jgi:excisionase family DNA binding protein